MTEEIEFMSEDEIKAKIKELKAKIKANNYVIDQKDIMQYCYKIAINSAYGAINSRMNPLGDDDIGNAICSMGSRSIQQMNEFARQFVETKRKELGTTSDIDWDRVVVFNDTDSLGIDFSGVGIKLFDGDVVTEEGYALVQEADDFFSTEFPKWYEDATNSHNCCLYFKREKICDGGLYLTQKDDADKAAKKNYVLHILDNEGVKHPKFKYTGVKFARSVMPSGLKQMGKDIVENMMLTQDRASTDAMIQKLYKDYCAMNPTEKAETKRCNNLETFIGYGQCWKHYWDAENKRGEMTFNVAYAVDGKKLSIPGHIRVAMAYNNVIKDMNLTNLQEIKGGDVVKIVPVETDNPWGIDKICFLDEWPVEFDELFKIDNKIGFEKIIYEELRRYYQTMGWPAFNPTLNYEFSLFDILGI